MGDRLAEKILLVGWDSADWKVIRPLMNQGKLPHLTRLIDGGVSGNLRSLHPFHSPMLWTSVATGKRPQKTGVCGYHEVAPDGLDIRPITSWSRSTKALWNILSQSNLRAHCVNWYASDPAEPINGVYVSRGFVSPPGPAGKLIHPAHLEDQFSQLRIIADELDPAALLELLPAGVEIDLDNNPRLKLCGQAMSESASVHAIACQIVEQHPFDLMAVLYSGLERFSHLLMPFHPPRQSHISEKDFTLYQHGVSVAYQLHDMMLGRLIELAGPDTTVIVLSDHGFKTGMARCDNQPAQSIEAAVASHDPQGIVVMRGKTIIRDDTIEGATLLDVAPTILTLLGLPVGNDMDGRPMLGAFDRPVIPDSIPSWDPLASNLWDRRREPAIQLDEQLRYLTELGYTESPTIEARRRIAQTRQDMTYNLARAFIDSRDLARAIPLLESLSKIDPCRADWNKSLFEALNQSGRYAEAREIIQRFWDIGERGALVHLGFALVDLGQRRPAEALDHLKQIANCDPVIPGLTLLAGQAYLRLREWKLAGQSFTSELSLNPNSEFAWGGLAIASAGQQDYQAAAEHALQAVGLKPDYPTAHYYLGLSLYHLQKYAESAQAFKRCLEIDPDFIAACRGLIAIYQHKLGDLEQAMAVHRHRAASMERRRLRRAPAELPLGLSLAASSR